MASDILTKQKFDKIIPKIDKEEQEILNAEDGFIIPKMCKFFGHNKKCKNIIIYGVCQYHHNRDLKEMRRLTIEGSEESLEEYEFLLSQQPDE